jgi:hypothetical protein
MPEKRMRTIKKEEPGAGGAQQRQQQQQHAAAAEERRFRGDKKTDALICRRQSESHADSQLRSTAPSAASPSSSSPANCRAPSAPKRVLATILKSFHNPKSPHYIGPPPLTERQWFFANGGVIKPYRKKIGHNWSHTKKKKRPLRLQFHCPS